MMKGLLHRAKKIEKSKKDRAKKKKKDEEGAVEEVCYNFLVINAPGLKGPPGASSNRIVCLSVPLSVCLSVCP